MFLAASSYLCFSQHCEEVKHVVTAALLKLSLQEGRGGGTFRPVRGKVAEITVRGIQPLFLAYREHEAGLPAQQRSVWCRYGLASAI